MLQSDFFNWRGDESESEIKTYSFETSVQSILVLKHLSTLHLHYPPLYLYLYFSFETYKFDKSRTLALEIIDTCSSLDATLFLVIFN